ncbi:AraC family transcriptional regulator [Pelagibius sp. Alg239-R121]|uniref:AraC family transcriptional regulator n=1 Tax=Pelagibius sp. Alg239-R121 TaxID=2993448 RepID=UPI0024A78349|nr:AraC family transcriptional regulator [Pelagibius sp. Alg239-R121]
MASNEDTLSEVLRLLQLEGCVYFHRDFWSPWAMEIGATGFAQFHAVTQGDCVFEVDGVAHRALAGDVLLFPRSEPHVLADQNGRTALPGSTVMQSFAGDAPYFASGERATKLICGHYAYRGELRHPLLDQLPEVVHVRSQRLSPDLTASGNGKASHSLGAVLSVLTQEMTDRGPGVTSVIERLAEVLLIQTLRAYLTQTDRPHGFLAGLADPRLARAVAEIHRRPEADLSLENLAQTAGMSRSAFAAQFKAVVGMAPIDYLTKWRMLKAGELLGAAALPLVEIAERVGYGSDVAFSRAFRREFNASPREYQRRLHTGL